MSYNVTSSIPHEEPQSNFMDAGIHENVELTKVEYNKTENSEYLAFYFVNENGDKGSHTEWIPKADTPEKQAERELNQISRIKQIAYCFVTPEQFIFQANNFEEFAKKIMEILTNRTQGVKLRVKFVYPKESSRYTGLPTYWRFRFIERMDNNDYAGKAKQEKSKIKILSVDSLTRKTPEANTGTTNPFTVAANGSGSPF